MGVDDTWPHLRDFCHRAATFVGLEVWLFGSALTSAAPADLDVLVMYESRSDVIALREAEWWGEFEPPLHIIAMTEQEEHHYQFIAATGARRLI